jgi:hypothetical protein
MATQVPKKTVDDIMQCEQQRGGLGDQLRPGPRGASSAFSIVNYCCMALLYGRAGRVTAQNDDFRPGQWRSRSSSPRKNTRSPTARLSSSTCKSSPTTRPPSSTRLTSCTAASEPAQTLSRESATRWAHFTGGFRLRTTWSQGLTCAPAAQGSFFQGGSHTPHRANTMMKLFH